VSLGWCDVCKELRHFDFGMCFKCCGPLSIAEIAPSEKAEDQRKADEQQMAWEAAAMNGWVGKETGS